MINGNTLHRSMGRSAMLLLILFCICGLAVPSVAHSAEPKFRVMTYNIHHGEGLDKKVDLERIAALIKDQRADIVALQEVDKGTQRTARRDFPKELSSLTGLACVFSNNYTFQGGEYGNALLTRFPIRSATNTHYIKSGAGETRGFLQVRLDVNGHELVCLDTHLDFQKDDAERLLSIGQLLEQTKRYDGLPVILCGDFNDSPGSKAYERMTSSFIDCWSAGGQGSGFTIAASRPNKRIDYIWLSRGARLRPVKAWVPETQASDHLPVVAEFEWN